MDNRWNKQDAQSATTDLATRIYSARLLGADESLVLHGGGNTSLKSTAVDVFGQSQSVLWIKGSGCDLKTITEAQFACLELAPLQQLAALKQLSDPQMLYALKRASMMEGPTPSLETLLHAIIPTKYVDHTHADAVVTLSNLSDGKQILQSLYGSNVLVLPFVKPGFELARQVYQALEAVDIGQLNAIVLLNHGLFTFADEARASYDRIIEMVTIAEQYIKDQGAWQTAQSTEPVALDNLFIAQLRKALSQRYGAAMLVRWLNDPATIGYSQLAKIAELTNRGPITPDHVIQSKRIPMLIDEDINTALDQFSQDYRHYFEQHAEPHHQFLDPLPRMIIAQNRGAFAAAANAKGLAIVADIMRHTHTAIERGEKLGGWKPLSQAQIFAMEYWSLEQAKLALAPSKPLFAGKVALVTGAASGIGKACVRALLDLGACVAATDIAPKVTSLFDDPGFIGLLCNVTDSSSIEQAISATVQQFGGLDFVISNAGIFPPGAMIEDIDEASWDLSLNINLSGHFRLIKAATPLLKLGIDPAIVVVGSKNVPAPGPGAAAYSSAKAGLTQLARVSALELAKFNIRVNVVHPNAVFDTEIWTEEVLNKRATSYGMTVDQYKKNNLLGTEITSKNVANLVCALCSDTFAKTTGAQIPIDGGNDRVI